MKNKAIELELKSLKRLAPAGYSAGIVIQFFAPIKTYYSYPEAWIKEYTENGYAVADPAVIWGMVNTGLVDWKDLKADDKADIFGKAEKNGLRYGVTCSVSVDGKKSIGSFARSDRPFTETEKELIEESLERLHLAHLPSENLTKDELRTLELTSRGLTGEKIAKELGIALQTVKQRLSVARKKLGAKNTNEAAALAKSLGLFEEQSNIR